MTSVSASRVTRSSRSLRLAIATFAGVLAAVTVLRAQETPPAAPAASPPTAPAGAPVPEAGADTEAAADEQATDAAEGTAEGSQPTPAAAPSAAKPDSTRPVGPTPGRFEPTEKVRADFDVAFPVDI
jgi:hypothetical protein